MRIDFTVTNNFGTLSKEMERGISVAIRKAAFSIEREAKVSIQTGRKSGRVYTRVGRTHQASAPGEAPATDYGVLVNSIQTKPESAFSFVVGVGAEYAAGLEFGTTKAAARPFLRPAVLKVKPQLEADLRKIFD